MALSSNSLIHFTSTKEGLLGILEEKLKVKYCNEQFKLHNLDVSLHIPMVSFCDIPFSQIKDHINNYGCYGIGLSKDWALRNRLNPVLYVQSESLLAQGYEELMNHLHKGEQDGTVDKAARQLAKEIARYIKNYEGPLERKGARQDKYRFSDEREWRYVPAVSSTHHMLYTPDNFDRDAANATVSKLRLNFAASDIKYLIIKDDSEISSLVSAISDRYTKNEVDRLATRIITSEQIHGDF